VAWSPIAGCVYFIGWLSLGDKNEGKGNAIRAMLLRLEFQICLSIGADCYICGLDNSPPSKMTCPASLCISLKRSLNSVKNSFSVYGSSSSGRFCLVTIIVLCNFM